MRLRKKKNILIFSDGEVTTAIKLEGGGGVTAFTALPFKIKLFLILRGDYNICIFGRPYILFSPSLSLSLCNIKLSRQSTFGNSLKYLFS